jgi:hypothetical protein
MPHTYTRALPRTGSGVPPIRSDGAAPSAAWDVIILAAVVEPAGDTVDVGSDDNSRHDTPVSRPWAIPSSFLCPPRLRTSRRIEQGRGSSSFTSRGRRRIGINLNDFKQEAEQDFLTALASGGGM